MNQLTILITMFIIGVLVKIVDMVEDDGIKLHKLINMIFGIVYGFLIALLISNVPLIAPLLLGVVIGVVLTGKIDGEGHYYGIGSLLFFLIILGLNETNISFLILFTFVGFFEEILNTNFLDKGRIKNNYLKKIIAIRPLIEIATFLVSLITGHWLIWFTILTFDIGYSLARTLLQRYKKIKAII